MTSQTFSLLTEITHTQNEKAGAETGEINLQEKIFTAFASKSDIEYCSLINRVTAAVETSGVQAGAAFLPELLATADGFEKFLNELDISYKRSIENWRHSFNKILDATDEIRQTTASVG